MVAQVLEQQGEILGLLQAGIPARDVGEKLITLDDLVPVPVSDQDSLEKFDRELLQDEKKDKLVRPFAL